MADLQKSISILYDLELNNYLMTNTINQIKEKDSKLCIAKSISKPVKETNDFSIFTTMLTTAIILALIGAVIGLVLGIKFCQSEGWFVLKNLSFLTICLIIIGCAFFTIVGGLAVGVGGLILGLIIGIIGKIISQKNVNNVYNYRNIKYRQEVESEEKRMTDESQKRSFYRGQIQILNDKLAESNKNLEIIYNAVGIDKSFRNLICMGYMEEYIRLQIATKLGGVDGLYFVIKQQLNFDQINASLNVIIEKLDTIIDNQSHLYHAISAVNDKCASMVDQLETISYNTYSTAYDTAINTYVDERRDQELDYLNYINS